ncbi:MAG: UDP-N-acetylmuramate dehydrogenase [Alistipes sp.]|nr:UDP-N-acetylmuramate dehydrogenase [Alistipes sp.]
MKVTENISLKNLNSFGVEARAARLIEWESVEELAEIPFGKEWMSLGGGNNILFTRDFEGTLIKSAARAITPVSESADTLTVRVEAGVDWSDFVGWCVAGGLWGAENLSAIPGTVGAAPIQNIGAYGAEVKDIISSVECFTVETKTPLTLAADHCAFGYRDSVFKRELRGRVVVTAVHFRLSRVPRPNLNYAPLKELKNPTLEEISRAVIEIRNSKLPDPRTTGNAGSFFKNPLVDAALARELASRHPDMPLYQASDPSKMKLAAGWLIEQAGWKGRANEKGSVGIHPRQALIVTNLGGATGAEIVLFAEQVKNDVRQKFGVELETEVNIC